MRVSSITVGSIPRLKIKSILTYFAVNKQKFRIHNPRFSIDADVRATVRRNFTHEYDFYFFCKQRLYKQYLALQLEDNLG